MADLQASSVWLGFPPHKEEDKGDVARCTCLTFLSNSDGVCPSPVVDKVANREQFLELEEESQKGEEPVAAEHEEVAEDQKAAEGERLERVGVESLEGEVARRNILFRGC